MSPDRIVTRGSRRTRAIVLPTILFTVALLVGACSGSSSPAASGSAGPSAAASDGSSPGASGGSAGDRLAATLPTQVGNVAMTVKSGTLTDLQGEIPNYATLVQQLNVANIQPSDVLGAAALPADGSADPKILGLTIVNPAPGGLGMAGLMQAWVSGTQGASSANTNVGGKPVVQITFSDGSAPLYYYLFDLNKTDALSADTTYFVRSADETLAADALSQLP